MDDLSLVESVQQWLPGLSAYRIGRCEGYLIGSFVTWFLCWRLYSQPREQNE